MDGSRKGSDMVCGLGLGGKILVKTFDSDGVVGSILTCDPPVTSHNAFKDLCNGAAEASPICKINIR